MDYPKPATPPVKAPTQSRRWLRRLALWLSCLVLLLGILATLAPLAYRWWTGNDFEKVIAEAERLDPGQVRWADLEKKRPALADDQNAALVILAVSDELTDGWNAVIDKLPEDLPEMLMPGGSSSLARSADRMGPPVLFPPSLARILDDQATATRATYERLAPLARLERGRFPDTVGPEFLTFQPHDAVMKTANVKGLIQLQANQFLQENRPVEAADAIHRLLGSARTIDREPGLLCGLVRMNRDEAACELVERLLAQTQPAEADLRRLQEAIAKERAQPLWLQALRGERAIMIAMYEAAIGGRPTALTGQDKNDQAGEGPGLLSRYALTGLWRDNGAAAVEHFTAHVEAARLPPHEMAARVRSLDAELTRRTEDAGILGQRYLFLRMHTSRLAAHANAFLRQQALLACAEVALAAERFRIEHRRWPGDLAELKPGFLPELPIDPYSGKPLIVKPTPSGLVIYSCFTNGTDDGGRIRGDPDVPGRSWSSDLGIQLWSPQVRRHNPWPGRNAK
jgi:hypothetical protein